MNDVLVIHYLWSSPQAYGGRTIIACGKRNVCGRLRTTNNRTYVTCKPCRNTARFRHGEEGMAKPEASLGTPVESQAIPELDLIKVRKDLHEIQRLMGEVQHELHNGYIYRGIDNRFARDMIEHTRTQLSRIRDWLTDKPSER